MDTNDQSINFLLSSSFRDSGANPDVQGEPEIAEDSSNGTPDRSSVDEGMVDSCSGSRDVPSFHFGTQIDMTNLNSIMECLRKHMELEKADTIIPPQYKNKLGWQEPITPESYGRTLNPNGGGAGQETNELGWRPRLKCEWAGCSTVFYAANVDEMKKHIKAHGITMSRNTVKNNDGLHPPLFECLWNGCGRTIKRPCMGRHMLRRHIKADLFKHAQCSTCGEIVHAAEKCIHENGCAV